MFVQFRQRLLFLAITFSAFTALASPPVYKSETTTGSPLYSSRPSSKSDRPHSLPTLTTDKPQSLPKKLETCKSHGGINCAKGADRDGSVICYDGFRGAENRFAISCTSARLSVVKVTQTNVENGSHVIVVLRNGKGVSAISPEVTYRLDRFKTASLDGPPEVPPYGSTEYQGVIPNDKLPPDGSPIGSKHLWITCENCG